MRRLYYFSWRDECPFALVLAFLLSAVYWLTLPPGVTFEDTGLLPPCATTPALPIRLVILYTRFFAFRLPPCRFFTAQSGTSNGAFIIDGRRCRRRFVL